MAKVLAFLIAAVLSSVSCASDGNPESDAAGTDLSKRIVVTSVNNQRGECFKREWGYVCLYGPWSVGKGHVPFYSIIGAAPEEAGYVTWAQADAVDSSGRRISPHMVHLHHAGWANPASTNIICAHVRPSETIYRTGKELARMELPEGYGYYWSNDPPPDHEWQIDGELMGMHGSMKHDVWVRLKLGFVPESEGSSLTRVRALTPGSGGCTNPTYQVKKGSGRNGRHERVFEFQMPVSGRFVWANGHLHDGAIKLVLQNLTTGETLLNSRALYGMRSHPWFLTDTTSFTDPEGIAVREGDRLRLSSVYDSTHTWKDVMGNLRSMIVPD